MPDAHHWILNLHGIGTPSRPLSPGEADVWLSTDDYLSVIDAVAAKPDVALTFDDGNDSDLHIALEPLVKRGLTATFFVCAGRIDQPGFLSTDAIRHLLANGQSIGVHGWSHIPWRGLDDSTQQKEIVQARDRISEAAGHDVTEAACPFGAYGRRTLSALQHAGYTAVYTSDRGQARHGAWLRPRCTLHSGNNGEFVERLIHSKPTNLQRLILSGKRVVKQWR